jgi:hypothetical protein
MAGKLLVDLVGLIFIFITLSGIFYWLAPHLLKRVKESSKSRVNKVNRFSLKWHNRLGYWPVPILLLTTITGIFLRPPLLISIANTEVPKIKYYNLDNPNTWDDKFRDLMYDDVLKRYVVATADGIYFSDNEFGSVLHRYSFQPPVSVMGINVFEKMATGGYLVGSFSGRYQWIPDEGNIVDYFTKLPLNEASQDGSPFSALSVSGFIGMPDGNQFVFDYGGGSIRLGNSRIFPQMPAEVIKKSPISLWNTSQEIHTGRIWEFLLGIGTN